MRPIYRRFLVKKVTLVSNGRCEWQILTPGDPTAGVKFATRELQNYVQQMSSGALRLVDKEEDRPLIVLGLRKSLSSKDRSLLPKAVKGHDGYAVSVVPSARGRKPRIILAGDNGRGVVYAAYDLLEKMGCRWFYPTEDPFDPEVVPFRKTLSLPSGKWVVASPFRHRICNGSEWFFDIDAEKALKQLDWAMKNRYNAMGWQGESKTSLESQYDRLRDTGLLEELDKREMYIHGPAHSFDHFLKTQDYFKRHPDWFGVRDGKRVPQTFAGAQFCWSNAKARKQFVANAAEFIKYAKAIRIFCTIPFDGGVACACDKCTRIGASNLLMTITCELIDMLENVRPDAILETTGGYGPTTEPPTSFDFHPKLRVVWAHWGRYHGYGYDDPRYDRKDNLAQWRKVCHGKLSICQYYTDNFAEPWIAPPFTKAMLGDRAYMLKHRIDSLYMLMWPKDYWWNHTLNGYLAGRVFYDVSLDPYALLKDYAIQYYGPKAGPLIGTYYHEWAEDPDLAYRVKNDALASHRAKLAAQRKKYVDPAVRAVKDDPLLSHRVGKVEGLHRLAEKLVEMYRQRDEIRDLRTKGKFAQASSRIEKARKYTDRLLDFFYELADLNQGVMDRKEVGWIIKIIVKGWIDEEAKKAKSKDRSAGKTVMEAPDETEILPSEVAGG